MIGFAAEEDDVSSVGAGMTVVAEGEGISFVIVGIAGVVVEGEGIFSVGADAARFQEHPLNESKMGIKMRR